MFAFPVLSRLSIKLFELIQAWMVDKYVVSELLLSLCVVCCRDCDIGPVIRVMSCVCLGGGVIYEVYIRKV